jgi:hypothetical protein
MVIWVSALRNTIFQLLATFPFKLKPFLKPSIDGTCRPASGAALSGLLLRRSLPRIHPDAWLSTFVSAIKTTDYAEEVMTLALSISHEA